MLRLGGHRRHRKKLVTLIYAARSSVKGGVVYVTLGGPTSADLAGFDDYEPPNRPKALMRPGPIPVNVGRLWTLLQEPSAARLLKQKSRPKLTRSRLFRIRALAQKLVTPWNLGEPYFVRLVSQVSSVNFSVVLVVSKD